MLIKYASNVILACFKYKYINDFYLIKLITLINLFYLNKYTD